MQVFIDWARANPAFAATLLWPLITVVLTGLFGPHSPEQLAKYPPWFATVLRFCGALGIDVPKLLEMLKGGSK